MGSVKTKKDPTTALVREDLKETVIIALVSLYILQDAHESLSFAQYLLFCRYTMSILDFSPLHFTMAKVIEQLPV